LRPGRFGFFLRWPLENGAALRLSLRRSSSICFRKSSTCRLQLADQADKIVSTEGVQIRHKNIMVRFCFGSPQLLNPVAGFHGRLPLINYVAIKANRVS
jgi:hypothetical protein